jgi:tetratricopeptide (TPR) repeat protein
MRLARLFTYGLLLGGIGALEAQIPTRRPTATQTAANSPRLLVGNPHSFAAGDSAPAVAIGTGLRDRLTKVVGTQFRVIAREDMNRALTEFGYPADAILASTPLRSLATSLGARVLVSSTITKDPGGKFTVTSRLAGLNDEAGTVVTRTQEAGEKPGDLGSRVAEAFSNAVKAWPDAKACMDQMKSAPEKAAQAAKKALGTAPKSGLANFCMGQLALARGRKADSAEAMQYYKTAVEGDPLSLPAWTQLAAGYEAAGDTAQTIAALRQMLLIAPTNQALRELAFKKFLAYNRPEIAEQVADEGLRLDPGNIDLIDLRANARIFRENYAGALDDLEQIIALDSSRADTTFFLKYLSTADIKPDTARYIKFGSQALRKFPGNETLLKLVAGGYARLGASDSLLKTLDALVTVDSATAVGLALQEAKNKQDQKQFKEADPFIAFAVKHGDAQAKEGAASFMLQGISPLLQPPQNWQLAADSLRVVKQLVNPAGRVAPIANYFSSLALVNLIVAKDQDAEKQKSCDLAREVERLSAEAEQSLAGAQPYVEGPGASQKGTWEQLTRYVSGLKPRTASMVRVYCK